MKEKLLLGLPELASEHGEMVDHMLLTLTYFMAFLGIFWAIFITYALIKFHKSKSPKASYKGMTSHWSSHMEIGVIIAECILLLGFAFPLWGTRVDDDRYPTGDDVVRLRAVGQKYEWTFHYPGADGEFGRVDPFLISSQNQLGIDPEDPNGIDDIQSKFDLYLPVGKKVVVEITSKDVIHSLHLLPMRMQQDAMPGTSSHVWFKPTKESPEDGWDILCGQLCGPGHANMAAKLYVTSEEDYKAWLESSAPKAASTKSVDGASSIAGQPGA